MYVKCSNCGKVVDVYTKTDKYDAFMCDCGKQIVWTPPPKVIVVKPPTVKATYVVPEESEPEEPKPESKRKKKRAVKT